MVMVLLSNGFTNNRTVSSSQEIVMYVPFRLIESLFQIE